MFGQMMFFIRGHQDPSTVAMAARQAVAEVDPIHPIANIRIMDEAVSEGVKVRGVLRVGPWNIRISGYLFSRPSASTA
jgi:hypothetical protein